jgi:hypothetical protein
MLQMRHARQCNATVRSVDGESMQATSLWRMGVWRENVSAGTSSQPVVLRCSMTVQAAP